MILRVEGIVIRAVDYGEGNRILHVLTQEAGKISMMARGAKKVKSRFSAISQPFTYGQFVIFRSSSQAMGTINSGELIRSHQRLREDLVLSAYAAYLAELTNRIIEEGEPVPHIFAQLAAAFEAMEEGKDAAVITHVYEMNMLAAAGFMPQLHACVSCGREDEPLSLLSGALGGTICDHCRKSDPQAVSVKSGTLKLLRTIQQLDLRRLGNVNVSQAAKQEMKQFIRSVMDAHLQVRWKSRDFIDQLAELDRFDESS